MVWHAIICGMVWFSMVLFGIVSFGMVGLVW